MFLVLAILVEVEEFPVVKRDRGGAGELEQQLLVTVIRTSGPEHNTPPWPPPRCDERFCCHLTALFVQCH